MTEEIVISIVSAYSIVLTAVVGVLFQRQRNHKGNPNGMAGQLGIMNQRMSTLIDGVQAVNVKLDGIGTNVTICRSILERRE